MDTKNDPLASAASGITEAIDHNVAVSAGASPEPPSDSHPNRTEAKPVKNRYSIRNRRGRFVSGGSEKKPDPSDSNPPDTPAPPDTPPDSVSVSRVVDPGGPGGDYGAGVEEEPGGGEPHRVQLGEDAGRVIADGVFRVVESTAGERAKPTDAEREAIGSMAAKTAGGIRVHPVWGLLGMVGLYVVRVVLTRKERGKDANNDTHLHRGDDPERQDPGGKKPLYKYPD